MNMPNERVDSNLIRFFDTAAASSSDITSTHEIAAILHDDHAQEILKELPAIGPTTYLSNLGVLVADVEKDGFDYLVEHRQVHAISDGEALCEIPSPLDVEEKSKSTSRELMRGDTKLFSEMEGKGITVGVVDTGVFRQHKAFGGRVMEQVNCVGDGLNGDTNGHGTHVAGSIAGKDIGVASEAEILDLRVFGREDGASTSSILSALETSIARKVDVVNMSLGGGRSYVLESAVDQVANEGIVVCVAAGNDGRARSINSPSSARNAICVAATDANGKVASFSSRGPCSWHPWPKPDCAGFGVDVVSASDRGGNCVMSGTSMATPGIAGVVACLLEHQKENDEGVALIEWLLRNAGESYGQTHEQVGAGFISLAGLEQHIGGTGGMENLAKKKKGRKTPKNFFKSTVINCDACSEDKVIHHISHRSDDTMRFKMSCRKSREIGNDGKPVYDEKILENWRHVRITDQQMVQALRLCGGCGKYGLVPIKVSPVEIKNPEKHHPHDAVKVGCLHCESKGLRKIPKRIADLWKK
jgi:hypothetical protein